jgi:cation transport regulator ChaC
MGDALTLTEKRASSQLALRFGSMPAQGQTHGSRSTSDKRNQMADDTARSLQSEPKVWVFFYGSYMNFDVLREVEIIPDEWGVARLDGFDIRIEPRANLVRSDEHCVFGIAATATHAELRRLYAHAQQVLGELYLPEAVLVQTEAGLWRPALCYICPAMVPCPPENAYVERILKPARQFGFPKGYVERLESFLTS